MNNRRKLVIALGAGALAAPLTPFAQPRPAKIPHVGYLSTGSVASNGAFLAAFKEALRELGYVEGRNIAIDVTWAGKAAYEFPTLAATLVKTNPSAIVTTCVPSTRAAKQATSSIPVVMSIDGDPVESGLVASLARPGANITGTLTLFQELIPKWVELINIAVPKARTIGVLANAGEDGAYYWDTFEDAARKVRVKVFLARANTPAALERAFADMKKQRAGAFIVMVDPLLAGHVQRIVTLAAVYKLPGIYGFREFAEAGGLMSYGLSYKDYYKEVARYVDKVLKGVKPADLPVEQPTRVEFTLNQATAKALGITVPGQLLVRANRVIE